MYRIACEWNDLLKSFMKKEVSGEKEEMKIKQGLLCTEACQFRVLKLKNKVLIIIKINRKWTKLKMNSNAPHANF